MVSLKDKMFKNKMIMEGDGYFFLSVIAVEDFIKKIKKELKEPRLDRFGIDKIIDHHSGFALSESSEVKHGK